METVIAKKLNLDYYRSLPVIDSTKPAQSINRTWIFQQ